MEEPHTGACGAPQTIQIRREKPPERLVGEAHTGGLGVVPQKIQIRGRRPEGTATMVRGCPSPGGRARGTARSRPWGGGPDPSLKKLIPNAARHEAAAQVNYNINKLMMSRCSAGLFTAGGHLSGHRRSRAFGRLVRGAAGPPPGPTAPS